MPDGFNPVSSVVQDALQGLCQVPKTLPAKLLYDAEGCRLFGAITRLPEYYPTRTELALLQTVAPQLPKQPVALIEYGASDEAKASLLLEALTVTAYVPIDVANTALDGIVTRMRTSHPTLPVYPVEADFLQPFALPGAVVDDPKLGFFPGSTIGNLDPTAAAAFLTQSGHTLGAGAGFLIGVDLRKDRSILIPAYDDHQGVTAAFNLNLLKRLNREAAASFDISAFHHRADWNEAQGRIEMHLVSNCRQTVSLAGHELTFQLGETIHTESSYKHTIEGFKSLALLSGWRSVSVWTDPASMFSLHLLRWMGH